MSLRTPSGLLLVRRHTLVRSLLGRAATTLLYAPSPQHANPLATRDRGKVHGPQVGNELWLHHDGSPGELEGWARPFVRRTVIAGTWVAFFQECQQ